MNKKTGKKFNLKEGIALVEVIAALGIAMVVITAMVSLSIYTLRSSTDSKMLMEGTKVTTREIELVRAYRDTPELSWDDFLDSIKGCIDIDHPCYIDDSDINGLHVIVDSSVSVGTGIEEIKRSFTATRVNGTQLVAGDTVARITATATWEIGGIAKSTHIYTDLTNWRITQ